ncbi:helix-turn-helix domain-containing protein [Streptomyces thermolineatus]|uniref:Helix-turn-helix domain-containing protein n=1 Tax=Streptomyces thermolineatus TaxID=44033 RepID=A0ABP5YSY2_9ACTN
MHHPDAPFRSAAASPSAPARRPAPQTGRDRPSGRPRQAPARAAAALLSPADHTHLLSGLPEAPPLPRSRADSEAVAALHRSARILVDRLPQLTDRLVAMLQELEPAYRPEAFGPGDLRKEVAESLDNNIRSLLDPKACRDRARRCSWRIGGLRAEHGTPLDAVLHAFRLGGSVVWQGLVETATRQSPQDAHLLLHVAADVWNFVDEHCTLVADAYRRAERRLVRRHEEQARALLEALLDGTARFADVTTAAAALGLPEQARCTVVLVSGGRPSDRRGVFPRPLPEGVRVVWCTGEDADRAVVVLGGREPRDLAPAITAPEGVRVGVGSAVPGLASLGTAREHAETALLTCPASGGVALLEEHLPQALVTSAPELADALVERALRPVLGLEPGDREVILSTLEAWLAADGSALRAGSRLFCHRNTVLNRLRRYEQLTGRSLGRPQDLVELVLALEAHRLRRGL